MLTAITDTGITVAVNVAAGDTISVVKAKIHEKYDIPTYQQRLIFDGEIFADDMTLADAGSPSEAFLHLRGGRRLEVKVCEGVSLYQGAPVYQWGIRELVLTVYPSDNIRSVQIKICAITGIAPWCMELKEALSRRPIPGHRLYVVSRIRCECWN